MSEIASIIVKKENDQQEKEMNKYALEESNLKKSINDLELIEKANGGDEKAFKMLVEKYQKRVYILSYSMLYNREDAKEVSQEAFIKVFRYLSNYHGEASFYTWLYRIVVNLCIDRLRQNKRKRYTDYNENIKIKNSSEDSENILQTSQEATPEKILERRDLAKQIKSALEQLQPYHRSVIIMREIEGLSYQEISETLGISIGTVMSRLFHARKKMMKLLKNYI